MQPPPPIRKLNVQEYGIYIWIPPEELLTLGAQNLEILTNTSTLTIMEPGETPDQPPVPTNVPLWASHNGGILFPKGVMPNLPVTWKVWQWDIAPGMDGENIKLSLRATERFPIKLEPAQLDILQSIREASTCGQVEAAMGAGKSWILLALALGHPLLRPCAISGKGEKDTKQLIAKLKALNAAHPEFAEPIMLSGLGRSLCKRDHRTLAAGEGIVVCTHAGLQNLPANTKLLLLDEAHAASTAKRITAISNLHELKKLYTLTGTASLRGDGGDEALTVLAGPTLSCKTHADFEATGRVTPAWINAYHFTGKGIYAENPFMPDQTPQEGYSLHSTWVENHRGRHQFIAELVTWLPTEETKLIFVPHVLHAIRICHAIEKKIKESRGDLTHEQIAQLTPVIFHAGTDRNDRFQMSKEVREQKIGELVAGKIKMAIATDFLSTGFDTNMIDHVIDASGQKAIITNIQRSGRGTRPRILEDGSPKILQIHTVLDKTHPAMHKMGEKKLAALCAYYDHALGVNDPNRVGGARRYTEPPWLNPEERHKCRSTNPNDVFFQPKPGDFDPSLFRRPAPNQ